MRCGHEDDREIVTLRLGDGKSQQYRKVYEDEGGASYERLMSPEARELANIQIVSKVIKRLNESD